MSELFGEIVKVGKELSEAWPKIIDFYQNAEGPNGEKFNLEAAIPSTDKGLWWFDERILAISVLLASFEKVKLDAGAPLPDSFVARLKASSEGLLAQLNSLSTHVDQVGNSAINNLTPSNWVVALAPNNQQINFASFLQNLVASIEGCLESYYPVAGLVKSEGIEGFSAAVREFSEKSETVRKNVKVINAAKTRAQNQTEEIEKLKLASETDHKTVTDLLEVISKRAGEIEGFYTNTQSTVEAIDAIKNAADALKNEVDSYREDFAEFQEKLEKRNTAFSNLRTDTENLFANLTSREQETADIIANANEMLAGATNAGLATTFDKTVKVLSGKLGWASWGFYFSILLLSLSAVPLGVYMLAATIDLSQSTNGLPFSIQSGNLNPATTVALFLLMVPTIWLTRFAAARHHQLFQLKEHYQFKYSLAMAVDGFKKQSPRYADEVAAVTFQNLSFNPADKLSGKGAVSDHPNRLLTKIMDQFGMNENGESK
ncbi:hypothetical protein MNBD_ALPHA12-1938 [hydrothermal vent metagenome]|uniref:Uncharacterized protein n=1 Tax=hydrothermal vent metagenome TaxID=652676 RepID=A0A3B0TW37_9ZZZZ